MDIQKFIVDKLEKMDDKMDDIKGHVIKQGVKLEDHNKRLDKYNEQLEIHIKGVETLEKRQDLLEEKVGPIAKEYRDDKAIKEYNRRKWNKWMKILGGISVVLGIVATLYKFV